jgi:hypothetical protein
MAVLALAIPILPGKTEQWRQFVGELQGARRREYQASRKRIGVHERAFFQSTPQGELVILTLEGADPAGAFAQFATANDEFTQWFAQQVREVHGVDLTQPLPGPLPELVADSQAG